MRQKRAIPIKSKLAFAVVVDGDCEIWYLQMLKRNERSINVNIEPKIPQKKSLTEQFQAVQELSIDYTTVFWIIDFDVILKETREAKKGTETPLQEFVKYQEKIKNQHKNVIIVVNNPCLELWLLLHFEEKPKDFNSCESAEKQLKKYLKSYEKKKSYYTKQGNDIYLKLRPQLSKAIENAKKLKKFDADVPHRVIAEMHLFFEANEFKECFKEK